MSYEEKGTLLLPLVRLAERLKCIGISCGGGYMGYICQYISWAILVSICPRTYFFSFAAATSAKYCSEQVFISHISQQSPVEFHEIFCTCYLKPSQMSVQHVLYFWSSVYWLTCHPWRW